MVENTTTEATEAKVEKTSRLRNFKVNHPRTARVVGIAAVTAATLGAVAAFKARKQVVDSSEELESSEETSSS